MPILHLIDGASAQSTAATLALLADTFLGQPADKVLLLGGADLAWSAQEAGLGGACRVSVPYGRAMLNLPRLLRALARFERIDRFDCWSLDTLRAVAVLRPSTPRRWIVAHQPEPRDLGRLLGLLRRRRPRRLAPTTVLAASPTIARLLADAGVPPASLDGFEPRLDATRLQHHDRAAIRRRWGLEGDAERNTKVVALLSDPPAAGDADVAAMAVGLTRQSLIGVGRDDLHPALLLMPDQHRRPRAQRMLDDLGNPVRVIQDAELAAPWRVLAGCDAAMALNGSNRAWALAAGCPVVTTSTHQPRDLAHELQALLIGQRLGMRG